VIAGIVTFVFALYLYRVYFKTIVPKQKLTKLRVVSQFTSEVFWGTVVTLIASIIFSTGVFTAGIGWLFAILVNIRKIEQL